MVPFLFLAPLCVEEKLLGAGGNGGVEREDKVALDCMFM